MLGRQPALRAVAWSEGPVEGPPAVALTSGDAAGDPLGSAEAAAVLAAARDGQETRLSAPIEGSGGISAVRSPPCSARRAARIPAQRRAALRGFVSATVWVPAFARRRRGPPAGRERARGGRGPRHRAAAAGGDRRGGAPPGRRRRRRRRVVEARAVGVAVGGLLLAGVVALLFVESAGRERMARGGAGRKLRHNLSSPPRGTAS